MIRFFRALFVAIGLLASSLPSSAQQRPWLGICTSTLPTVSHLAAINGYAGGVKVTSVAGPAAAAGAAIDDLLLDVDGQPAVDFQPYVCNLASKRIGDAVTITVIRAGELLRLNAILQPWPEDRCMPALTCADSRFVTTVAPHFGAMPVASTDLSAFPAATLGSHPGTSGCPRRGPQDNWADH
jgi:hypothetical protein